MSESSSAPSCSARGSPAPPCHQAQVDEVHPLDPQRAQVVLDALAQLRRGLGGQPGARLVAAGADLGDELEVVGYGMQGLADQVVDDVGAVVLGGVDVVDAELDRPPQDGADGVGVARRAEYAGARELHRAEADAVDGLVAEEGCLVHGDSLRPRSWLDKGFRDPRGDATRVPGRA